MRKKPPTCYACPFNGPRRALGFAAPEAHSRIAEAKLALCGEAAGELEAQHGAPFVGRSGTLLWRILEEVGISRSECLVDNVLRCRPSPANEYPMGSLRREAETYCADHWSFLFDLWIPTCIILAPHPARVAREASWRPALARAAAKAAKFASQGERPLILLGTKAVEHYLPNLPTEITSAPYGQHLHIEWEPSPGTEARTASALAELLQWSEQSYDAPADPSAPKIRIPKRIGPR